MIENVLVVDEEKAERILKRIIIREKLNLNTSENSNAKMITLIQKMIEEEVKCY